MHLRALGDLSEGLDLVGWAGTGSLVPTFISSRPSNCSYLFPVCSPLWLGPWALRTQTFPALGLLFPTAELRLSPGLVTKPHRTPP